MWFNRSSNQSNQSNQRNVAFFCLATVDRLRIGSFPYVNHTPDEIDSHV